MTDFVRVEAENGVHVSLPKGYAEARGLNIVDEPAVDGRGKPLPAGPTSSGATKAPKNAARKRAAKKAAASPAPDTNPSGSETAASTTEEK